MKNIAKWLEREGFAAEPITLVNIGGTGRRADGLKVSADYTGPYPGKEQFDALDKIRRHISKYYPGKTVEPRGHYTAIFIY